jgi:hypothetical protein
VKVYDADVAHFISASVEVKRSKLTLDVQHLECRVIRHRTGVFSWTEEKEKDDGNHVRIAISSSECVSPNDWAMTRMMMVVGTVWSISSMNHLSCTL